MNVFNKGSVGKKILILNVTKTLKTCKFSQPWLKSECNILFCIASPQLLEVPTFWHFNFLSKNHTHFYPILKMSYSPYTFVMNRRNNYEIFLYFHIFSTKVKNEWNLLFRI